MSSAQHNTALKTVERYTRNIFDPVEPFITPGPPGWCTAVNVNVVLPLSQPNAGFVLASPSLHNTIVLPSDQPATVGWTFTHEEALPSLPGTSLCSLSAALVSGDSEVHGLESPFVLPGAIHITNGRIVPGAKYYPGVWNFGSSSPSHTVRVSRAGTYIMRCYPVNSTGLGTPTSQNLGFTDTLLTYSGPAGPSSFWTQGVGSQGFILTVSPPGTGSGTYDIHYELYAPLLSRGPSVATQSFDLRELLSNRPGLFEQINSSVGYKISAMSLTLTNASNSLEKGGSVNVMQFPAGSFDRIPRDAHRLYAYMGTAPAVYGKTALPLKDGAHIYYIPDTLGQHMFRSTPEPFSSEYQSCLAMSWDSTVPQTLVLRVQMNVEYQTLNSSVPLQLRSCELSELYQMIRSCSEGLVDQCGCNPDHLKRVAKAASTIVRNPHVRQLVKTALYALPGLMAL